MPEFLHSSTALTQRKFFRQDGQDLQEVLDRIDKINGIGGKGNWKPETGELRPEIAVLWSGFSSMNERRAVGGKLTNEDTESTE
jgi:hypothetical protein